MSDIYILTLDFTLRGGIERYCSNIAYMLAGAGRTVSVASLHRSNENSLYSLPPGVSTKYYSALKFGRLYKITAFFALRNFLKHMRLFGSKGCTVISTHPIITIYIAMLDRSMLPNVVASEHSTYEAHGRIVRALRIFTYRKIRAAYTQTDSGAGNFIKHGVRCSIIPNPVTIFNDKRQWIPRESLFLNESVLNIICVGRLDKVKQFDHVIRAASLLRKDNVQFEIYGDGPEYSNLLSQVKFLELETKVKFRTSVANLSDAYCANSYLLITSSTEAFPMVMLEAMSFGLPIIAYDQLVGPSEVILDSHNGYLVAQNNIEELALLIRNLVDDSTSYGYMSTLSVRAANRYSPNRIYSLMQEANIL